MTEADPLPAPDAPTPSPTHTSRLQLVWDVALFQFKLVADGLRDVLLSPLALAAAVMGLVAGGDDPHRYFRELLAFGRRSEIWINLFGRHRRGTSDAMADGVRERVFTHARENPWLSRAGSRFNERLDGMNLRRNGKPPAPKS